MLEHVRNSSAILGSVSAGGAVRKELPDCCLWHWCCDSVRVLRNKRGCIEVGSSLGTPLCPMWGIWLKNRRWSLCAAWAGCFQKGLPFRAGAFRAMLSSAATCWLAEYVLPSQMGPITARSWLAPGPRVLKGSHSTAVRSRARRAAGRTLTSAESEMIWAVDEYGKYMLRSARSEMKIEATLAFLYFTMPDWRIWSHGRKEGHWRELF